MIGEKSLILTQGDLSTSLRDHLESKGYQVSIVEDRYNQSLEVTAVKNRENLIIEGVWETSLPPEESVIYAIGKMVKRMKEPDPWIDYGLAIPKSYFKVLRNFEVGGLEKLKLHLFLVENIYTLTHLNSKTTRELVNHLKAGNLSTMHIWGINYE